MLRLSRLLNPRVSRGCSLSTVASRPVRSGEKQELFKMAFQVLSKYIRRLDGIDWTFSREEYDLINSTIVKCARSGYLDTAGYILEEAENRCGRRAISAQTYRELILGFQSGGNKFLALNFLQRGLKMRVLSAKDEETLEQIVHGLQRPSKAVVEDDEQETIEQRAKQSYKQVVRAIDLEKSIDRTSEDIEQSLRKYHERREGR
ncbi:hypothetical protein NDN08_000674 [Rhodosorus marinus]|uniref:Uncharacterized protein n=1 Tax=Rhodosorus marinus TaxID=101924 RepID=A0AAV8UST0_9RHOD|nr:hypothetical protein NDN08_000674 [Rhodosorus marinus]